MGPHGLLGITSPAEHYHHYHSVASQLTVTAITVVITAKVTTTKFK